MTSPMINAIRGLLDAQGWDDEIQTHPAGGHIRAELSARFGGRRCSASIDTWEDAGAVVFAIYAPFTVRPDRLEQACLLFKALGGETVWGCFRLDADDGMLSYDATARFPASDACGPEGVWNLLRNGIGEFERLFPALEQLATTGRSAQEILAAQAGQAGQADEPVDDFVSYDAAANAARCSSTRRMTVDGEDENHDAGQDGDGRQPS